MVLATVAAAREREPPRPESPGGADGSTLERQPYGAKEVPGKHERVLAYGVQRTTGLEYTCVALLRK